MGCCASKEDEVKQAAAAALRRRQQQYLKEQRKNKEGLSSTTNNENGNEDEELISLHYNLNGPDSQITGTSNEPTPCFEQGLLYRISDADSWFFYNDSFDMVARVLYLFGASSEIEIGPKTTMTRQNDGALRVSLTLLPGETQHLSSGRSGGYTSHFSMHPLSEDQIAKLRRERNDKILSQSSFLLRNLAPSLNRHHLMSLNNHGGGGGKSGGGDGTNNNSNAGGGGGANSAVSSALGVYGTALLSPLRQQQEEIEALAMQLCQANRTHFIDPIFFPSEHGLGGGRYIPASRNFPFYRYREILPARYNGKVRVADNVRPGEIVPGELGDTAFMCAVASLAEIPELVRRLFPMDEQTGHLAKMGAYRVRVVVDGLWTTILIDDFFPCRGLRPAFARHRSDPAEIYLEILQKAYAKRLGSYYALTSCNALHTLNDLTGFACVRLDPQWEAARTNRDVVEELFQKLLAYSRAGFITILNTPSAFDRSFAAQFGCASTSELAKRYVKAGLKLGYSYNVQRLVFIRRRNLLLIKLRNPWSLYGEWQGDWSDDSSKWKEYPDVADACRFTKSNDGFFWMSFFDAIQWFSGGTVCRSRLSYYDYRCPGYFDDRGISSFAIEVDNLKGDTRISMSITLTKRNIFSKLGGNTNSSIAGGGGVGGGGGGDGGDGGGGGVGPAAQSGDHYTNNSDSDPSALLLSIWKLTQDGAPFRLLGNSTPNPETLSSEWNYLCSRDVSADCSVEPGASLLIVPCGRGVRNEGTVLSIQTSQKFETEQIMVARGGGGFFNNNNSDDDSSSSSSFSSDVDEDNFVTNGELFGNKNNSQKNNTNNKRKKNQNRKNRIDAITTAGFRSTPEVVGHQIGLRSIDRDGVDMIKSNYQRRNPDGSVDSVLDAFSLS